MRGRTLLMIFLLSATLLAGCTDGQGDGDDQDSSDGAIDISHCEGAEPREGPAWPVAHLDTTMGTIDIDLHLEMVPHTVTNFICLAEAGYYDGTAFHRIIGDFMMQGGDPNSKDDNPQNDGQGGPGYSIPDEFHRLLRHDEAGVISMANSGPNTGGSQFFITFGPTPHLDDKHTIFGHVTGGMDVVERVNQEAASPGGTPQKEVVVESLTIEYEDRATPPALGYTLWAPQADHTVAEGGDTRFVVVVESQANQRTPTTITVEDAGTVTATIEEADRSFELPAQQRRAFVVTVQVPEGADTVETILIGAARGSDDPAATIELTTTQATLGPEPTTSDTVQVDYAGLTIDGRIFDTSMASVGNYAVDNGLTWGNADYGGFSGRPQYDPATFQVSGVVPGFTALLVETPEGGQNAARLSPEEAYGTGGCQGRPGQQNYYCLSSRTLLFDIDLIEITS